MHLANVSGSSTYQKINLYVITAVSLSDTLVLSLDGVCESSHSHANRKPFIGSRQGAKVVQGPGVCVTYVEKHLSV